MSQEVDLRMEQSPDKFNVSGQKIPAKTILNRFSFNLRVGKICSKKIVKKEMKDVFSQIFLSQNWLKLSKSKKANSFTV